MFKPAFRISGAHIRGNTIMPNQDWPEKGDAQVWRSTLETNDPPRTIDCWMLRRLGSVLRSVIELVHHENLREAHGLRNGDQVTVVVYEGEL